MQVANDGTDSDSKGICEFSPHLFQVDQTSADLTAGTSLLHNSDLGGKMEKTKREREMCICFCICVHICVSVYSKNCKRNRRNVKVREMEREGGPVPNSAEMPYCLLSTVHRQAPFKVEWQLHLGENLGNCAIYN